MAQLLRSSLSRCSCSEYPVNDIKLMAGASPGFDCTAVDLVILLTAEYVTSYVSSLPEKHITGYRKTLITS